MAEIKSELNGEMQKIAQEQKETIDANKKEVEAKVKKAEEQIEEDEVKACVAWMIDRVSQDYMDDKFEEALQEVAGSID